MPPVADRLRALREDRVALAVVVVVGLGLVARLAFLGARVAHWDEARVAYWALDFSHTGAFSYRPILHGPFLQQVNRVVFWLIGPSDFSMRLVVALLGAALPLVTLLFRHRLRAADTVALAVFFAADPILLYYSRFMRADLPLAVFMTFSFGFFVRAIDTRRSGRRSRYVYAGVLALALGFTTKENVLLYLATWLGGLAVVAEQRFFIARWPSAARRERAMARTSRRLERLRRRPRASFRRVVSYASDAVVALVVFLVVIVFFYAPRTAGAGDSGLDDVFVHPEILPDVLGAATVGSWKAFAGQWVSTPSGDAGDVFQTYLDHLGDFAQTLGYGAGALVGLAVIGFLVDRYTGKRPNDLVVAGFAIGVVNVFGYPYVTDIKAPWLAVHAVVWFAFPAAAGAGALSRYVASAVESNGWPSAGVAAVAVVVLALVAGQIAFVGAGAVYLHPQAPEDQNPLVQYAQPHGDLKPALGRMDRVAGDHTGPDVLVFGSHLVDGNGHERLDWQPTCSKWFNALPLPWYFERAGEDLNVTCVKNVRRLDRFDGEYPPVVIARETDGDAISPRLEGYTSRTYLLRTNANPTTFFFAPNATGTFDTAAGTTDTATPRQRPLIEADALAHERDLVSVATESMDTHRRDHKPVSMRDSPVSASRSHGEVGR